MKKNHIPLLLTALFIVFSCEREFTDPEEINNDKKVTETEIINKNGSVYPNLTFPQGLVNKYMAGHYTPLQNWINAKNNILENQCLNSNDCEEKVNLVDQLIYLEWQKDVLGITNVTSLSALCNGFLDNANTLVEITPPYNYLEIGDVITLQGDILVGQETCEGDLQWGTNDVTVATVDQYSGVVTAVGPGWATIGAMVDGLSFINGTSEVFVGSQDYDIVFVVETGSGTYWMVGFDNNYLGIKQLAGDIANKIAYYFSGGYRFGLVGFEHYPASPWGSSLSDCYAAGYNYPDFEPLIEMSPFHLWLDFAGPFGFYQIIDALEDIQLMCSYHDWPATQQSAPFSALIQTITTMNWREDGAHKVIVLIGSYPACYVPPSAPPCNGVEGFSGYTVNDVISTANQYDVKIYTINGFTGQSGDIAVAALAEYAVIANGTGGSSYSGGQLTSMLDAIDDILNQIKNSN